MDPPSDSPNSPAVLFLAYVLTVLDLLDFELVELSRVLFGVAQGVESAAGVLLLLGVFLHAPLVLHECNGEEFDGQDRRKGAPRHWLSQSADMVILPEAVTFAETGKGTAAANLDLEEERTEEQTAATPQLINLDAINFLVERWRGMAGKGENGVEDEEEMELAPRYTYNMGI
nr:hypothetical protein Iba_chr03aCG19710 [Ipomoea batatas]GMC77259.1 hypothetical protein Iba_chr03eCG8960 [Ipomoea batatas]